MAALSSPSLLLFAFILENIYSGNFCFNTKVMLVYGILTAVPAWNPEHF